LVKLGEEEGIEPGPLGGAHLLAQLCEQRPKVASLLLDRQDQAEAAGHQKTGASV
jgi:hypothetical protein